MMQGPSLSSNWEARFSVSSNVVGIILQIFVLRADNGEASIGASCRLFCFVSLYSCTAAAVASVAFVLRPAARLADPMCVPG